MGVAIPNSLIPQFFEFCRDRQVDPKAACDEILLHLLFSGANDKRAWVRLQSGRCLDLIHPTPWDWEISDLTAGQATIYRWKEATVWSRPLVLTQHNFSVLEICKSFSPTGIDPGLQIACLVHDGSESLSGFGDVITPLKPFLGPAYHVLEDRMQRVIHRRLGLKEVLPPSWKAMIKKADKIAAASEGLHVAGWTREQIRRDLLIKELPLLDDPVAARFGGVPWEPWEPAIATRRYQAELDRLLAMRGD